VDQNDAEIMSIIDWALLVTGEQIKWIQRAFGNQMAKSRIIGVPLLLLGSSTLHCTKSKDQASYDGGGKDQMVKYEWKQSWRASWLREKKGITHLRRSWKKAHHRINSWSKAHLKQPWHIWMVLSRHSEKKKDIKVPHWLVADREVVWLGKRNLCALKGFFAPPCHQSACEVGLFWLTIPSNFEGRLGDWPVPNGWSRSYWRHLWEKWKVAGKNLSWPSTRWLPMKAC